MNVEHHNYLALEQLLPGLALLPAETALRLESRGRPVVSVHVLRRTKDRMELTIGYRVEERPSSVVRPMEMRVLVFLQRCAVEARSRTDHHGVASVNRPLGRRRVNAQRALDDFLSLWLSNLESQDYRVTDSRVGRTR